MNKQQSQLRLSVQQNLLKEHKLDEWETWAAALHSRHFYFIMGVLYLGAVMAFTMNFWGTAIWAVMFVLVIRVVWNRGEQLREYNEIEQMLAFMSDCIDDEEDDNE